MTRAFQIGAALEVFIDITASVIKFSEGECKMCLFNEAKNRASVFKQHFRLQVYCKGMDVLYSNESSKAVLFDSIMICCHKYP